MNTAYERQVIAAYEREFTPQPRLASFSSRKRLLVIAGLAVGAWVLFIGACWVIAQAVKAVLS